MEQFFIQKFKNKTDKELQHRIDHPYIYNKEAVNAAIFILNERSGNRIVVQDNQSIEKEHLENDGARNDDPLGLYYFFRTFGINEFLSIITFSIFFLAYIHLLYSFLYELIGENHIKVLRLTGFFILPLFIHIIYRLEQKHPNSYVGRCVMDFFYVNSCMVIASIYQYVIFQKSTFFFDDVAYWILFIIGSVIIILLFELFLNLLKALLKNFRCPLF